jgi:hypothetical protein
VTAGRGPAVGAMMAGVIAIAAGVAFLTAPAGGAADAGRLPMNGRQAVHPAGDAPTTPPPAAGNRSAAEPSAGPPPPPAPQLPVRLVIPALAVTAPVVDAPVTAAGSLRVPDDPSRVGWWTGGAQPGAATGTLLLAGHVDDRAGPGALFHLAQLSVGAAVYVDGDRNRYGYRITARRTYLKQRLPATLFDRTTAHRLVLITCGGRFHDDHYDDNVVVYAEPAPAQPDTSPHAPDP